MSFQSRTIKEFEKQGFTVLKTIKMNKSGYPDLMCLKDGRTVWIECKEGKDTLKPLQKLRIKELRASGFKAYAIHEDHGIIY